MNCTNCNASKIKAHSVDDREQLSCTDCGNRWYSHRKWSNAEYSILDDIADEVAKIGKAKYDVNSILNFCFNKPHKNIDDWCLSHGFHYTKSNGYYHFKWSIKSHGSVTH
jgi:hypothetical protein